MAMAEKTPLIALRLEGALQSWGDHSKWDERDSGSFPSKSGVVGLIACAMGLERGSEELLALADHSSGCPRRPPGYAGEGFPDS